MTKRKRSHLLWPVCVFFWKRNRTVYIGNAVSNVRALIWKKTGWEWV